MTGITPNLAQTISPPAMDANADLQRRIERARSLAVVGQGVTAARELEAIRVQTSTDLNHPARGVAGVLLMGLYLEQADYRRAQNLLEDAATRRSEGNTLNGDSSAMRTYYAIAGQLLNGVRSRLERYRVFNVPVAGSDMTAEVTSDIDGMRALLDALVRQARTAREANGGAATSSNMDAAALFEDAVGMRLSLARSSAERTTWQRELADARQHLAAVAEPRLQPNTSREALTNTPTLSTAAASTPSAATGAPATDSRATETAARESSNRQPPANNNTVAAARPTPEATNTSVPSAPSATPRNDAAERAGANLSANTAGAPLEVGSLVERATQRVPPSYPPSARNARVGGVVTVYVVVNEEGRVAEVQRAAGPQLLRRAAEEAARRWRFRPVVVDGQPVRAVGYISFNFTL